MFCELTQAISLNDMHLNLYRGKQKYAEDQLKLQKHNLLQL